MLSKDVALWWPCGTIGSTNSLWSTAPAGVDGGPPIGGSSSDLVCRDECYEWRAPALMYPNLSTRIACACSGREMEH